MHPALARAAAATAAASALALTAVAPAGAEVRVVHTYSAIVDATIDHHRTGRDDTLGTWVRDTTMRARIATRIDGLDLTQGGLVPAPRSAPGPQVSGTDVSDTITYTLEGDAMFASCFVNDEGTAGPAKVSFRPTQVAGAPGMEMIVQPFSWFNVPAICSGFSDASGTWSFFKGPVEMKASFPLSDVGKDVLAVAPAGPVPCAAPVETELTTGCEAKLSGTASLVRQSSTGTPEPSDDPDAVDDLLEPLVPPATGAKVKRVKAAVQRSLKKGTVTATCPTGCKGKISAYAVARERERRGLVKPKPVGKGKLKGTGGGPAKGTVTFGRAARAAIRSSGAVEYRLQITPNGGPPQTRRVVVLLPRSR